MLSNRLLLICDHLVLRADLISNLLLQEVLPVVELLPDSIEDGGELITILVSLVLHLLHMACHGVSLKLELLFDLLGSFEEVEEDSSLHFSRLLDLGDIVVFMSFKNTVDAKKFLALHAISF